MPPPSTHITPISPPISRFRSRSKRHTAPTFKHRNPFNPSSPIQNPGPEFMFNVQFAVGHPSARPPSHHSSSHKQENRHLPPEIKSKKTKHWDETRHTMISGVVVWVLKVVIIAISGGPGSVNTVCAVTHSSMPNPITVHGATQSVRALLSSESDLGGGGRDGRGQM
ncbi:hypothetical protein SERLA73DRAFT_73306 [Serpula lacrymans var. lacrymans S7.3]|uniref:Uncharacterized protein n=2 Tax=Serpula lacrymans var. lacrymans TaxID=341189 RepID=F8PXU1_SERL3|nr:uncharacterized protein SERLADRAFT_437914 [Serpula lacrymans var. lacrymans S7.9]EGN98704.1 hypothetical protein SERLA73DRAFT_73306 [Serpula lacrymans var. lacrymans S7.3]EGO24308.1 hypothetical protein SERLADRAFT_437914 [Serpula lacrymans var. lacrymans S7.9]